MGGFKLRKKQLFAVLLAGAVTAGTLPSAAWAAEAGTPAVAAEAGTAAEQTTTETPAEGNNTGEQTPAETTQAPEETPAADPVQTQEPQQTPAEGTVTEAPAQTETPAQTTEAPAEAAGETEQTEGETKEETKDETQAETKPISITTTTEGQEPQVAYYDTLQDAVNAVTDTTKETAIEVSANYALTETVKIEGGKKIQLLAAPAADAQKKEIQLARGAGFTGDMFSVSGEGSQLSLGVKAESEAVLTVNGSADEGVTVAGALVNVSAGGVLGVSSGVKLTGNNMAAAEGTAGGSAIKNDGGRIVLMGGEITGNAGGTAAVYSNGQIDVQGTVNIKDNTGVNLYLAKSESALINVTNKMEGSSISLVAEDAADAKAVIKTGNSEGGTAITEEDFKAAVGMFTYGSEDYKIEFVKAEDGTMSGVLKAAQPSPQPSGVPTNTPTPTPSTPGSNKPEKLTLAYQDGSRKWIDHYTAELKISTTQNCKWNYFYVPASSLKTLKKVNENDSEQVKAEKTEYNQKATEYNKKVINDTYKAQKVKVKYSASANTVFTVKAENVPEEDSWIVVIAKTDSGLAQMRAIALHSSSFKKKRPEIKKDQNARTHKVTETKVTGLEQPLKFYPNRFYDFNVIGAGQEDDASYVTGDERWKPLYWAMSVDGSRNTNWRIGSQGGIQEAKTYPLYIFLRKQVYNGTEWIDTDVVEYITTQFSSAAISEDELKNYVDEYNKEHPDDKMNYDGTPYTGSQAELTATAAAKDAGSTTKSAVNTADESPIGTMSTLAVLSLLAGGYILVRKRKKEEI